MSASQASAHAPSALAPDIASSVTGPPRRPPAAQRTASDVDSGGAGGDVPVTVILTLELEGAADGSVTAEDLIDLGRAGSGRWSDGVDGVLGEGAGRILAIAGAVGFAGVALVSGIGGLVLLRRR